MGMLDGINAAVDIALGRNKSNVTITGKEVEDKKTVNDPGEKFTPSIGRSKFRSPIRILKNINFYKPEYDLPVIANAVQLDGLLNRSVNIFVEQILKNGFDFVSKNERVQHHVRRRVKEIENFTGVSLYETITVIARQLVTYGNAYLIKVRKMGLSKYGKNYELRGSQKRPIVGLFVVDAATIEIGLNSQDQISHYKQSIRGNEKIWKVDDVIHFYYNKIPGTLAGISNINAILDDLRALRKLEEEMEILGFQYSVPLYLYKVGNKDQPAVPGEVERVANTINNMPAYGIMTVPGHHSIEVPSSASDAPVDIIKFVEHFKRRVYAGLGISPIAMGEVESSNRNTSEILDLTMQTITNVYQHNIKHKLEMELLREFRLDGKFKESDDDIELNFPEIDLEAQVKKENHVLGLYQGNVITLQEARLKMDSEAKMKMNDTYLENVQIPLARAEADAKASAAVKNTAAKNKPTNQHGSSTRPKIKKDFLGSAVELNDKLIEDLIDFTDKSQINYDTYIKNLSSSVQQKLLNQIDYTINELESFYHINSIDHGALIENKDIQSYLDSVDITLRDRTERLFNTSPDGAIFRDDINFFIYSQKEKVKNLSIIVLYKELGIKSILVNADNCELHSSTSINIDNISYNYIPPFKYGCGCIVEDTLG